MNEDAGLHSKLLRRMLHRSRAILYGTLTVGTLDLLDAFIFFYLRSGVQPVAILHSIASGLLGPTAARAGGLPTAALGFFLHFLIAFIIVSIYFLASRRIPILRSRPVVCGLAYGVLGYFVMTYVGRADVERAFGRAVRAAGVHQRDPDPRVRCRATECVVRGTGPALRPQR